MHVHSTDIGMSSLSGLGRDVKYCKINTTRKWHFDTFAHNGFNGTVRPGFKCEGCVILENYKSHGRRERGSVMITQSDSVCFRRISDQLCMKC